MATTKAFVHVLFVGWSRTQWTMKPTTCCQRFHSGFLVSTCSYFAELVKTIRLLLMFSLYCLHSLRVMFETTSCCFSTGNNRGVFLSKAWCSWVVIESFSPLMIGQCLFSYSNPRFSAFGLLLMPPAELSTIILRKTKLYVMNMDVLLLHT